MENYDEIVKNKYGTYYYLNNKLHRIDGPAEEYGPDIEYANGNKYWFYEGKFITNKSQEEFERLIKLKLFW